MDCDPPVELERKGFGLIDEWLGKFVWPAK